MEVRTVPRSVPAGAPPRPRCSPGLGTGGGARFRACGRSGGAGIGAVGGAPECDRRGRKVPAGRPHLAVVQCERPQVGGLRAAAHGRPLDALHAAHGAARAGADAAGSASDASWWARDRAPGMLSARGAGRGGAGPEPGRDAPREQVTPAGGRTRVRHTRARLRRVRGLGGAEGAASEGRT